MKWASPNLVSVTLLSWTINATPLKYPPHSNSQSSSLPSCPAGVKGGTWSASSSPDISPIPTFPRQEHITIPISSSIFAIIGGIIPIPPATPGANETYATTGLVQFYDTATDTWTSAPDLPVPLNHANAAFVNGKIFALSGLEVAPDNAWRATDRSWVLDLDLQNLAGSQGGKVQGQWRELERVPSAAGIPRGSAAVALYKNKIYLAGGMTVLNAIPGGEQNSISSVLVFDTVTEKWLVPSNPSPSPLAPNNTADLYGPAVGAGQVGNGARKGQEFVGIPDMPAARDHAGVALLGSTLYILGGRDHGQVNVRDTVFSLDLSSPNQGWTTRNGKLPTARGGLAAAAIRDKVYTFGGEGNPAPGSRGIFNETEVYDTRTDTWERLAAMQVPRHGTYAVGMGQKVWIPGGGVSIGAGPVAVVDYFEPCI